MARSSMCGNRPAYLDNLFRENPPPPPLPKSPSLRSSNRRIASTSAFDLRTVQLSPRLLPPAFEEEQTDDKVSVKSTKSTRSLRLQLSARLKIRSILNRRTYPQVQETVEYTSSRANPSHTQPTSRQPSLPKVQTAFSLPHRKGHPITSKPLPAAPPPKAERLKCQPCYYFAAHNCNGYVMGGSHGDACDNCAVCVYACFSLVTLY